MTRKWTCGVQITVLSETAQCTAATALMEHRPLQQQRQQQRHPQQQLLQPRHLQQRLQQRHLQRQQQPRHLQRQQQLRRRRHLLLRRQHQQCRVQ